MSNNEYGFQFTNELLEDYLTRSTNPTGRSLKETAKAGARAAANTFAKTAGSKDHRRFFQSCLEGSGVDYTVAAQIAEETPVHATA